MVGRPGGGPGGRREACLRRPVGGVALACGGAGGARRGRWWLSGVRWPVLAVVLRVGLPREGLAGLADGCAGEWAAPAVGVVSVLMFGACACRLGRECCGCLGWQHVCLISGQTRENAGQVLHALLAGETQHAMPPPPVALHTTCVVRQQASMWPVKLSTRLVCGSVPALVFVYGVQHEKSNACDLTLTIVWHVWQQLQTTRPLQPNRPRQSNQLCSSISRELEVWDLLRHLKVRWRAKGLWHRRLFEPPPPEILHDSKLECSQHTTAPPSHADMTSHRDTHLLHTGQR